MEDLGDLPNNIKSILFAEGTEDAGVVSNGEPVVGYDFNKGVDYKALVESFATTGFQALHFSQAK
jgi:hypothetical protein